MGVEQEVEWAGVPAQASAVPSAAKAFSVAFDFKILSKTIPAVLRGVEQ
jgi:hypothetical protein